MRLLVNIDVDDLERGAAFYTAALGLVVGRHFGNAVELLGLEAPLYLLHKPAGSAPHVAPARGRDYARHWTPIHLDLAVDDLLAARDRALAAGATLEEDVAHHAWGSICILSDPFGHGFCLLHFTTAGYDALGTVA